MLIRKIDLINVLTDTLDYLETNLPDGPTNHSKRTTLIALKIASFLGLENKDVSAICSFALIHDCATSSEEFPLLEIQGRDIIEKSKSHCIIIENIIPQSLLRGEFENIILYHHENWDGSGFFSKKGNEIPLLSQIIKLANDIEILYRENVNPIDICEFVKNKENIYYSPYLVKAFNEVQNMPLFYQTLKANLMNDQLKAIVGNRVIDMDSSSFSELATIFKSILNTKSPFTNVHSSEVASLAAIMADHYNFDSEKKEKFIFAAIIHDVGKLLVPNYILDKKGPLTKAEVFIIKKHPIHTERLLKKVSGIEDICSWASQHHEKLNGTGYPYGLEESDLCFESQLLSVLDIYEALSADRPYRKALSFEKISEIMRNMVIMGELNSNIVETTLDIFNLKKDA
jgi:HD-GYP domain-containing protein (c-di-GMP phosphodiesterase class II)